MNLNQITVPSLNVDQAVSFYESLGLQLIVKSTAHYARFRCPDGASTFSIQEVESLPLGDGVHVYFECDDLDQQVTHLQSKGIIFDELPNGKPWLWREAHLRDLDGNHLILYYAGKNRLNPPWKLK